MEVAFASSSRGRGSKKRAQNSMIAATGALYNAATACGPAEGDRAEGAGAEARKRACGVAAGVPAEQLGTERGDLVAAEGFESPTGPAELGQLPDSADTNADTPKTYGPGASEGRTEGRHSQAPQGQKTGARTRNPCTKPTETELFAELRAVIASHRQVLNSLRARLLATAMTSGSCEHE